MPAVAMTAATGCGRERADEHEELGDEAAQARQRQAGQTRDEEDAGQRRRDPLPATEVGDALAAPAARSSIAAKRNSAAVEKPWLTM